MGSPCCLRIFHGVIHELQTVGVSGHFIGSYMSYRPWPGHFIGSYMNYRPVTQLISAKHEVQIQKSGEEFISEKQQEQEKIQKLSSSDQQSCLYKGKNCQVQINDCVPFTLSSALCLRNLCTRQSLADGICSGGSLAYFYDKSQQYNTANIDVSHHKLIYFRDFGAYNNAGLSSTLMYRSTYTPGSGMSGIFENLVFRFPHL